MALVSEGPETLHEVIQRPADGVGQHFGPQPPPAEAGITDGEDGVAGPKVDTATD